MRGLLAGMRGVPGSTANPKLELKRLAAHSSCSGGELFWKLAVKVSPDEAPHRATELAAAEARLLETLPIRAAIH